MDARAKRAVSNEQAELLRQIPSVDELLLQPRLAALSNRVDRGVLVEVVRAVLADLRARIAGDSNWSAVALHPGSVEELIPAASDQRHRRDSPHQPGSCGAAGSGGGRIPPDGHTVFESGIRFGGGRARQARRAYR